MWCTRWFIPLLILPLPTAPPYFLLLFIFSLTLHARPCFYCVTLLTALFISSCYWQPIPLESQLSQPWSENITTFADALSDMLSRPLRDEERGKVLRLADRCWCDMSMGVFTPFDLKKWEWMSVKQLKDEIEREERVARELVEAQVKAEAEAMDEDVAAGEEAALSTAEQTNAEAEQPSEQQPPAKRKGLFSRRTWFTARSPSDAPSSEDTTSEKSPPETPEERATTLTPETVETNSSDSPSPSERSRPWKELPVVRRKYDLQAYGFDMVVDFGWST